MLRRPPNPEVSMQVRLFVLYINQLGPSTFHGVGQGTVLVHRITTFYNQR